jgi:hypothetical protein
MGQKGLSHFYFGKNFKWRGDRKDALLHFGTALESLDVGSPEREEAQREIKELTPMVEEKKPEKGRGSAGDPRTRAQERGPGGR